MFEARDKPTSEGAVPVQSSQQSSEQQFRPISAVLYSIALAIAGTHPQLEREVLQGAASACDQKQNEAGG
jgi:hypothetical protein